MNKLARRIPICLVFAFLACTNAYADVSAEPARTLPALRLPEGCHANEYELAQCLFTIVLEEEARLDAISAKVRAALRDKQRQPFDDFNDAWRKYVRASCEFDTVLAAGSSASARHGFCVLMQTRLRTQTLSKYLAAVTTGECGNDVRLFMIEYGFQCPDP